MWYQLNLVVLPWLSLTSISQAAPLRIAKPGCKDYCGNVAIPYPFGIGPKCYHNPWYEVECEGNGFGLKRRDSVNVPTLDFNFGTQINWGERTLTMWAACTGVCGGFSERYEPWPSIDLRGSPFLYSGKHNVLLMGGCEGGVILQNRSNQTVAGCATVCASVSESASKNCYGIDCCQTTIPSSLDYYQFDFPSMVNVNSSYCISASLVDSSSIAGKVIDKNLSAVCSAPVVLKWKVVDLPILSPSYANSSCYNETASAADDGGGYVCRCKADFFVGNPYLPHGCQVVRECESCVQDCISLGNHTYGCPKVDPQTTINVVGLVVGISIGSVLLLLGSYWFYHFIKKRRDIMLRATYFERNGGMLLLKQQMCSEESSFEKTKIFTSDELGKATDQYNEDRILGQGGQGTVYKGMLSDGKIVAVKKSKIVDESQLNVFINEVVILSQINHRSVVRLLGCCLETEIPMLIYEYVPNGTLSQHIHASNEDYFPITWQMRLQIASDIASALAYLHSSSLIPIFHRDIKSSNILLDSKYRAKLSDFGISKSVGSDQTHVTTRVIGTFGYLDPEYFQSNQFTDKSDVYSFGVVLVELLTGQKAIRSAKEDEERGLVSWFLEYMENSSVYDILDAPVLREGRKEEIVVVANLGRRCLSLDGKKRPTMKEVAAELETLRSLQRGLTRNPSTSSTMEYPMFGTDDTLNLED